MNYIIPPQIKEQYFDFLKSYEGNSTQSTYKFKGVDLKKIRLNFNLSQRCFASMLNISVRTLQNYERDRRSIPGTARSLFIFANDNIELFRQYYLCHVDNIEPYRKSMNSIIS